MKPALEVDIGGKPPRKRAKQYQNEEKYSILRWQGGLGPHFPLAQASLAVMSFEQIYSERDANLAPKQICLSLKEIRHLKINYI